MKTFLPLIAAAGLGAAIMSGAAFAGQDKGENDGPDPRIGEKVDRICFAGSINGWRSLKGEDNAVLLQRSVNDWYKAELVGGCRENLFRSALSIGIDSRPAGGCVTRGDVIIVEDTPGFTRRCTISAIYKWDEDAAEETEDSE